MTNLDKLLELLQRKPSAEQKKIKENQQQQYRVYEKRVIFFTELKPTKKKF